MTEYIDPMPLPQERKPKLPGNQLCLGKCGRRISGNKAFCLECSTKQEALEGVV